MRGNSLGFFCGCGIVALLLAGGALVSPAATMARAADPVVLTGADLPAFVGRAPADLVAFRYAGTWQQIPVQVDERAVVDFGAIYHFAGPIGVARLVYTDAGTWTGADPDPSIDADDEVVFMAADAGARPPSWSEPPGVVAQSGLELEVTDPVAGAPIGYVYLFRQGGSLDPAAGQQYVQYTFNLLSGDYKETYDPQRGPHPEDSLVVTPAYRSHFADRWVNDELRVVAGGTERPDLLDRHKALFAPGNCVRSEDTFANGADGFPVGVFIANKSGPVRAIRSFLGANSGPLTQREHLMYAGRQDIRTMLRVHSIPGVMDFYDYTQAASGMQYHNNNNLAGVVIDGTPDQVAAGPLRWELVTGEAGSLAMVHTTYTDIPGFAASSYYLDDATPADVQCTGDSVARGSSGVWVNTEVPCTDQLPQALGGTCPATFRTLETTRTVYYDAPGTTVERAEQLADAVERPPEVASRAWLPDGTTPSPSATVDPAVTPSPTATVDPAVTPSPSATVGVPQNPVYMPLLTQASEVGIQEAGEGRR